jgi:hypothetical protein
VPVAGQDAEVAPGWNMNFDVAATPLLGMLKINGRLTFNDSVPNQEIHAHYIFIKAGELIIGNKTNPYPGTAKIILYGE